MSSKKAALTASIVGAAFVAGSLSAAQASEANASRPESVTEKLENLGVPGADAGPTAKKKVAKKKAKKKTFGGAGKVSFNP